jgi:hypothetical protein
MWLSMASGIAILVTVLGFNLLGEGRRKRGSQSVETEEPADSLVHIVHDVSGQSADEILQIGLVQRCDLGRVHDGITWEPRASAANKSVAGSP